MSEHVQRLGLALIKGTRHVDLDEMELDAHGPVGDRDFCLVDVAARRVLRTVENPGLLGFTARSVAGGLEVTGPDGQVARAETRDAVDGAAVADYWGRGARIRLQDSALSAVFSRALGREVVLARAERGDVVYAEPVSIVTTGALRRLAGTIASSGYAMPQALDARFRATLTLVADEDPPPGTRLQLGDAVVEVGQPLERCAVIDLDPATGQRTGSRLLPLIRTGDGRLLCGVGARVVSPGRVRLG
ncbi:MOSC domain-containing protein [Knoellia sp. Soil729]|uniref:MOSC domain-containing protein n=1 Tax=Knoellia sp. Soil729 TaxID=1736394 RepID=UPI0006F4AF42|nr:MOSC N-terminal beta barrel domain-containing protein [Knoellia sp. Soil729]KRE42730.1 hypothetical protein ASG74_10160 [Knoellia sp. Soil729]